jgi:invasion protein IalB
MLTMLTMLTMRKRSLAVLAALSLSIWLAPTAPTASAGPPCGYYEAGFGDDLQAWFNNCSTTDGFVVRVERNIGPPFTFEVCALPGVNHLGPVPPITGAEVVSPVEICA